MVDSISVKAGSDQLDHPVTSVFPRFIVDEASISVSSHGVTKLDDGRCLLELKAVVKSKGSAIAPVTTYYSKRFEVSCDIPADAEIGNPMVEEAGFHSRVDPNSYRYGYFLMGAMTVQLVDDPSTEFQLDLTEAQCDSVQMGGLTLFRRST